MMSETGELVIPPYDIDLLTMLAKQRLREEGIDDSSLNVYRMLSTVRSQQIRRAVYEHRERESQRRESGGCGEPVSRIREPSTLYAAATRIRPVVDE
jgi:hypothetical protein